MRYVTLICKEDPETGMLGLNVEGMPYIEGQPSAATEGRLIAHDIIEHQNGIKNIGSIGDELEALGAIWYVCGQYGDINRGGYSTYSPEQATAFDIVDMGRYILTNWQGYDFKRIKTKPCDADEAFENILEYAKADMPAELEDEDGDPMQGWEDYAAACMDYMRTGYRKAAKRFKSGMAANSMFWNIADAVDRYAKSCDYEGQRFRLAYDRYEATCEEIWEEEW